MIVTTQASVAMVDCAVMKAGKNQRYWLLKTEPDTFSFADLARSPHQSTLWEGVRNYQARNFMRDDMQKGDLAFFYHSSCKEPAIMGVVTITEVGLPDVTAMDPQSPYYDPKASPTDPRWFLVQVQLKTGFQTPITLHTLKQNPALVDMALLKPGNRLSVLPITSDHWKTVMELTCHHKMR